MNEIKHVVDTCERVWAVDLSDWKITLKPPVKWLLGQTFYRGMTGKGEIRLFFRPHPDLLSELIPTLVHELAHAADLILWGGARVDSRGRRQSHDNFFKGLLRRVEAVRPDWVQDLSGRVTVLKLKRASN